MLNIRKSWRSAAALAATATLLAACGGGSSDVAGGERAAGRRDHADARRLRRAGARLEQDHPGVRRHAGGQGCGRDHVVRRLRRSVARRRRRQAGRHRQLLGRARRDPPGQGQQGGQGLERRRHQGHPVRVGGFPGRPQGQPQEHQGLGRPAAARDRGRHPEPVELRLRQVEPVGALRREEQRRQ